MRSRGLGDVVVVRDHQDRLPTGVQPPEQLEHLVPALGVERARRLVGEQQRRLVRERTRDREALPLTTREHARRVLRLVGEAEQVEQVACAVSRPRLRGAPAMTAGSVTFSSTLMPSSRLKNWKTMPMWRAPHDRASSSSLLPMSDSPASDDSPSVGVSSPATRLSSVDFPQPDGPITATNSPGAS